MIYMVIKTQNIINNDNKINLITSPTALVLCNTYYQFCMSFPTIRMHIPTYKYILFIFSQHSYSSAPFHHFMLFHGIHNIQTRESHFKFCWWPPSLNTYLTLPTRASPRATFCISVAGERIPGQSSGMSGCSSAPPWTARSPLASYFISPKSKPRT